MDKTDPCRIEHAQICIRCESITVEKRGGLRGQICAKCHDELKEMFNHWKEHGLYACDNKPIPYAERNKA